MGNYELIIERIAKASGLETSEIESKIDAKKESLSGLISREGAAQIIAAELGINFEEQELKIREVMPGTRKINVVGKIIVLFPVREFERNGRQGKVVNFRIADETGNIKVVLWDLHHIELIENGTIKKGDVVEIRNGSVREDEIHLSGFSELKKSDVKISDVKIEVPVVEISLEEAKQGQSISVRGTVVQLFQPRFYFVCSECGKKVSSDGDKYSCGEHGVVSPKEKAILNFVLDDGTETMRVVLFSDQINSLLSENDLKDEGKLLVFREDFLGKEIYLSGSVKRNHFFNNLEVIASSIEKVDVEKLIGELESSA